MGNNQQEFVTRAMYDDLRAQHDILLARLADPTDMMVDAAFNAGPKPAMRADRSHYRAALIAAYGFC